MNLLTASGTMRVERSAIDRFGGTLPTVTIDGQDVGQKLISERLVVRLGAAGLVLIQYGSDERSIANYEIASNDEPTLYRMQRVVSVAE